MFTTTATTAAPQPNTHRGSGCQPRLLAHSIPARPRAHSVIAVYIMRLIREAAEHRRTQPVRQRGERQQHRQRRLARAGRGRAKPGEGHQSQPDRGHAHRGPRPRQRAGREHPDQDAHQRLDPAAGYRRLGELRGLWGGGMVHRGHVLRPGSRALGRHVTPCASVPSRVASSSPVPTVKEGSAVTFQASVVATIRVAVAPEGTRHPEPYPLSAVNQSCGIGPIRWLACG